MLFAPLWYNYLTCGVLFLSFLVLCMTWNGATFYFEVFADRYEHAKSRAGHIEQILKV